jgi:CRISPR/Cas system-associated exonuclease Cas4 (RecB family)
VEARLFAERITSAINAGMVKNDVERSANHQRRVGVYYPSSLGYCLRKQYYAFYYPKAQSPAKLIVFALGDATHELVAMALAKSGDVKVDAVELPAKLEVQGGVVLSGRIDVLVAELAGEKVIMEIKSASSIPNRPYISHIIQIQTYLHTTGLTHGVITYVDKKSGDVKSFDVLKDDSWLHTVKVRALELHTAVKSKLPPYKEAFSKNKLYECKGCDFAGICLSKSELDLVMKDSDEKSDA